MRVLVIGGTGNTGRQVVSQLMSRDVGIRVLTRSPEASDLPAEVEVVRGDLTRPETVERGLDGVDAVFLVWVVPGDTAEAVVERIAKRTSRIVFLSAPHKTPHPLFQQPNPSAALHAKIEGLIEGSGLAWTFLRPGMFAANARHWWAPQIRAGDLVRWPYLDVPTAPIHERDIAAVAVRALCEEGHGEAEYVLTGPESLSQREQLTIIGRATGREVRMEEIPPEEARRELAVQMPASVVNMLMAAWSAAAGQPALVTSTVEEITGVPARRFLDWVTEHAAEFCP